MNTLKFGAVISAVICLALTGCGKPPSTERAKAIAVQELRKLSDNKIKIAQWGLIDGREVEMLGIKMYTTFLYADIEFLEDVGWSRSVPFRVSTPKPKGAKKSGEDVFYENSRKMFGENANLFLGDFLGTTFELRKSGAQERVLIEIDWEKYEKGWVWVDDIRVK